MPEKSVGFAIGNLRARENRLLKKNDLSGFAAASNVTELARMLRDKGIGKTDNADVPALLHEDAEEMWKYLTDNAPDTAAFAPFLCENDFHNYKAVLKGIIRGREYEDLLILPASVELPALQKAVKEKRFDLLPDYMQKPAAEAYEVLVQSGDSQLADCIIDAGCMSAQTLLAEKSKNTVIKDLITVSVFYKNIKAALRAAKTGRSAQFIESTLTETGVVSKKAMVTAALGGEEKVLELLSKAVTVGGAEAAEAYKKSPGDFEKYADNRLLSTAKRCKYITIGIEPLIGYMLARKAQITDLQIIYSGVKTGQGSDKTLERLRELYG